MQMEYIWAYLTGKWVENNAILCYYPVYREIRIVWSFIEILCVNIINSNSLFTHCLRKSKKKAATKFVTACFPLWTSLGLNQGPPDYESVALTNWATSPVYPFTGCGHKSSAFCRIMQILLIKICYSLPSKLIFAFRILGKPAFPYPFFLFKDLFNGPEGRESEYA